MEPKIRLKGFSGEWQNQKLGEIASFSKGSGYSKSDLCDEGNPIILYGRLYTKYEPVINEVDTFTIPRDGSVYSKGGEVIIPGSGETPEDISIASSVKKAGVILGGDLNVLSFDSSTHDSAFMAMAVTNSKTHKELSKYAQGKTIVHLHNSEIAKGAVAIPSLKEQKDIVKFVLTIDSLIQSATKKMESLKQVKAASLQAMFPQEGETVPKVRFKGFEGEWYKTIIDNICIKKVSVLSENSLGPNIGNYPVYGATGYIQNIPTYDIPYQYVGIVKDGSGVGRCQLYPAYSSLLGTMQYILPKVGYNVAFLAYLFQTLNFSSYINGSSIPHIYFKDYCGQTVYTPTLKEQELIANYFQSLDSQITLQSQRVEKLKQIKSACLDQMFV